MSRFIAPLFGAFLTLFASGAAIAVPLMSGAFSFNTVAAATRHNELLDRQLARFFRPSNCDQVVDKRYFRICYDYRAKGARFVGYVLDGSKVDAVNIKKRPRFYPERAIPARYRTYPSDYTRNEFHADRGHLAPDASFDWSKASQKATYSMANIVPQYWRINRKTWIKAERYERLVARRLGRVTVLNGVEYGDYSHRLRKSGIAIPVAFWKAIWNREQSFRRCFYYRNKPLTARQAKRDRLRDHEVDCRQLLGRAGR